MPFDETSSQKIIISERIDIIKALVDIYRTNDMPWNNNEKNTIKTIIMQHIGELEIFTSEEGEQK